MSKNTTRKDCTPIKVYCLPSEREAIKENADKAGMTLSSFLNQVGQGYKIQGVVDAEKVREMARINGDLGRLGGLLKLWLTNDKRTAQFGKSTIVALLEKIEANQDEMANIMTSVMLPKSQDALAAKKQNS